MAISIKNHYLSGLTAKEYNQEYHTPNLFNPPEFRNANYPDSIIIHYTAMASALAAVKALCNPATKASAHLVVAKDGTVYQLAPFNYRTWHAGISEYGGRKYYNNNSIGIEIDNLGWLDKLANGSYGRNGLKPLSDESKIFTGHHWNTKITKLYLEKYTPEQLARVKEICEALVDHYHIDEILGHDEISVDRKQDPGPAFPMEEFKRILNTSDRSQTGNMQGTVIASSLNIRDFPNISGQMVAKPLSKGAKVEILEEQADWYRVRTEVEGWVAKKYIQ